MEDHARIIGIAGPSCSGKTTLARTVAGRIEEGAVVIGLDSYYHDRSGIPESEINVDEPGAIEHKLLLEHLGRLAAGEPIEVPAYDYATHSRAARGIAVSPAPTVIVEGLFVLYWPALRTQLHLGVYVDADHETCVARRIDRDVRERGRTRESVIEMYEKKVRPMYELHVRPTRSHADLVLQGVDPVDTLVTKILERME